MQHRWMALGGAPMTDEQAREWTELPMKAVDDFAVAETGLEVHFSTMLCVVCLEHFEDALPACLGPPDDRDDEHLWQAFLTAPATDEDAAAWADPDGEYVPGVPRSVAVHCVLCGQGADSADAECSVRTFWTKDTEIDLDPSEFTQEVQMKQGGETEEPDPNASGDVNGAERIPKFARRSDEDASLFIVADPEESDGEEWRLFKITSDGTREEIERVAFWSTGFGEYEGRPGWFAGGSEVYDIEIHLPGRSTPFLTHGGHPVDGI